MSQSGYTPIQLYYSVTASNIPSTSNLKLGELAFNIADNKIYALNTASNAIQTVVGTLGNQNKNSVSITGGAIDGTTVGATTASTGAFTTLSASSTVSGTGFSTYLASPPAIGGTAANAITGTTITASTQFDGPGTGLTGTASSLSIGGAAPAGSLSGTTLNSTVVSSSLTSVGTLTTGTWHATTIETGYGGTGLTSFTANGVVYASSSSALSTGSKFSWNGYLLSTYSSPNSWYSSSAGALQLSQYANLFQTANGNVNLSFACYESAANTYAYATTGDTPALYSITGGTHIWSYATSTSTAGSTVSLTEGMRLNSGGNFLVGTTTSGASNGGFQALPAGNGAGIPAVVTGGNSSSNSYLNWGLYSTSASQYQFYVGYGGTVYARSTTITGLSDATLKTNIKPLETGLAEINKLQPRRFDWTDNSSTNVAGFIAQEVQTVLPDLVENFKYNDTATKLGLKMGDMIPTMVNAIQQLSAQVTALQVQVNALIPKA